MSRVLRVAWRVLALLVVAAVYLFVAVLVVTSTKPAFEPEAFSRAESAAIRDAAKRGDESICGLEIPEEFRASLASGNASIAFIHADPAGMAACLHETGYLDGAGLAAAVVFTEERKWRWWEKALFVLGLVGVVGFAGFLLFHRPRRDESPGVASH